MINPSGITSDKSLREKSQEGMQIPKEAQEATRIFASLAPDGFTYFGSLPTETIGTHE